MASSGRLTLGLPRMRKEPGERRDFLPPFVRGAAPHTAGVLVEEGIGSGMGVLEDEYRGPGVVVGTHEEAYAQDVVLVVRMPDAAELRLLRPGATLVSKRVPGVEVTVADFDLTWHEEYMLSRLQQTDLLIDATQRLDYSRPVIPNAWIAALPPDAVLLDLSADTYDFAATPPKVKGIEGVPVGNLDQWVFHEDDPAYERIDPRVRTANRRLALSCYAWPGLKPRQCMETYGSQLEPVVEMILADPAATWDPDSGQYEQRAVARAEVTTWLRAAA